jgi:hypothetical protein
MSYIRVHKSSKGLYKVLETNISAIFKDDQLTESTILDLVAMGVIVSETELKRVK